MVAAATTEILIRFIMALALSLHAWNNTPQDWLRLEATLVILHHRPRRTRP